MNMLASVPAIIEQASDEEFARREVVSLWLLFQESARAEEDASQEMRRRLFALGKKLATKRGEYRDKYGERGPKAKAWGEFLLSCGIEQQRASEAMRYAGYVEKVSPPGGETAQCVELPSLYEAGIKEHPKKEPETKEEKEPEPFHVLIAVGDLRDDVEAMLADWPPESLPTAAVTLREIAKAIDKRVKCK